MRELEKVGILGEVGCLKDKDKRQGNVRNRGLSVNDPRYLSRWRGFLMQ